MWNWLRVSDNDDDVYMHVHVCMLHVEVSKSRRSVFSMELLVCKVFAVKKKSEKTKTKLKNERFSRTLFFCRFIVNMELVLPIQWFFVDKTDLLASINPFNTIWTDSVIHSMNTGRDWTQFITWPTLVSLKRAVKVVLHV